MKLVFIIVSLTYFFCMSSIIFNILNYKTTRRRYLASLLLYVTVLLLCCVLKDDIFVCLSMLFSLFQIFTLHLAFHKTKITSIVYTYFFMYFMNTIIVLFIAIAANISHENTIWVDFLINCLLNTTCFILCYTKPKIAIQQMTLWTPLFAKRILLFLLFLSSCLLSFSLTENYRLNSDVWFAIIQKSILIIITTLLLIIGILVCVMLSNNRLKQLTTNYEQQILAQAEHYKLLAESNYEIRRFKHDFKNMSIAMETLLKDKGNPQALELLQQYNNALEFPNNSAHFYDTGNGIAAALLADKQQKATSCNCNIVFEGAIPTSCLLPTDICVILGNTLDNAIEACDKIQSEDPLTITVSSQCNSGFMFLSITNPISEKINISNNYIATTKKNKTLHGFGLYSLNSVVKKYDGNIELKATENTFTANIDLPLLISAT